VNSVADSQTKPQQMSLKDRPVPPPAPEPSPEVKNGVVIPANVVDHARAWLADQQNAVLKESLVKKLDRFGPVTVYLSKEPNPRSRGFMLSTREFSTQENLDGTVITQYYGAPSPGEIAVVEVARRQVDSKGRTAKVPPTTALIENAKTAADL
jgi:hypothetical protein